MPASIESKYCFLSASQKSRKVKCHNTDGARIGFRSVLHWFLIAWSLQHKRCQRLDLSLGLTVRSLQQRWHWRLSVCLCSWSLSLAARSWPQKPVVFISIDIDSEDPCLAVFNTPSQHALSYWCSPHWQAALPRVDKLQLGIEIQHL